MSISHDQAIDNYDYQLAYSYSNLHKYECGFCNDAGCELCDPGFIEYGDFVIDSDDSEEVEGF